MMDPFFKAVFSFLTFVTVLSLVMLVIISWKRIKYLNGIRIPGSFVGDMKTNTLTYLAGLIMEEY